MSAQRNEPLYALGAGVGEPSVAQHTQMVRDSRLGDGYLEPAAGQLAMGAEQSYDLEPDRITERMQDVGEMQLLEVGMRDYAHGASGPVTQNEDSCAL